jgi:hypothetical protein
MISVLTPITRPRWIESGPWNCPDSGIDDPDDARIIAGQWRTHRRHRPAGLGGRFALTWLLPLPRENDVEISRGIRWPWEASTDTTAVHFPLKVGVISEN